MKITYNAGFTAGVYIKEKAGRNYKNHGIVPKCMIY